VLPWAQPSYAELQKIAVRSWYETSNQVTSFARSTFESMLYTQVPELKPVSIKAKAVIHMFKPTHFGIQFSKNVHLSQFIRYLLATFSTEFSFAATKEGYMPSRIAANKELIVQVLGEGIRLNILETQVFSQGMEKAIDQLLRVRELAGDMMKASPTVLAELRKIADEIRLVPRTFPEYKALVLSSNLGFEYALELTQETIIELIGQVSEADLLQKLKVGISAQMVSATNIVSYEIVRPIEAGLPMVTRQDFPSVVAAKASVKYESAQGYAILGNIVPVLNIKLQSDAGVIVPFTEEHVGNGVTMAFHTAVPLEGKVTVRQGELDIVLKAPQQVVARGKSLEAIHGFVMPYTARSPLASVEPVNKATDLKEIVTGQPLKTYNKQFTGLINAQFNYVSDNDFIDFYSYWQKIQQNSVNSLPHMAVLPSSVRKSEAKLEINPTLWELKQVQLKIQLWSNFQSSALVKLISQRIDPAVKQEIQRIPSLKKAYDLIYLGPATIVKITALVTKGSSVDTAEIYSVLGYHQIAAHHVKSTVGAAVKISQGQKVYGILYEGELKTPKINARWNKEQLLNQPISLLYNGEVVYGEETNPQGMRKIVLRSALSKTQEQIKSLRESPEFAKCDFEAREGRRLSPICIKVRQQAGSLDKAVVELQFPEEIYQSPVLPTIEDLVKANFIAHYKQLPVQQLPEGKVKLEMNFTRAGDVADLKVEHRENAYQLKTLRIPYAMQGLMPINVRNSLGDWIEQRTADNYAPASCRIEPRIVSTFDNKTYAYTINDYEHVLLLDGSKTLPIAVVARTVSGEQKEVKILSGETKVEIIPGGSSSLKVKVNGQERAINQGETFIKQNPMTWDVIVEIKHFQDGVYHVYVAAQLLHVLTDGKSIEVVAPQLLKNRAVGLCGDLNGEEVADLPSPQKCIMNPRLAAFSYMMAKRGNSYPCAGVPHSEREELTAEIHECVKEIVVPTPIIPLFERALTAPMPLLSAHKVEKQMNKVCISKEKIKTCGGALRASSQGGMTQKTMKFACVAAPSTKAQTLEKRAMAGESLGAELTGFSTTYTKMEAEPMYCGSYGGKAGMGGMGMGGNSEFGGYGNSGIGGGYGSSHGNGGSAPSSGATGGMGGNSEFGSYGNSGIGGASGSSFGSGRQLKPVTFNFNDITKTLTFPNGEILKMDKNCDDNWSLKGKVRIEMQGAGGPTGFREEARGLSKCTSASATSCSIPPVFMAQGTEKVSTEISIMDLHSHVWALTVRPLRVGRRHGPSYRPVYQIKDIYRMIPGCAYTFTWIGGSYPV